MRTVEAWIEGKGPERQQRNHKSESQSHAEDGKHESDLSWPGGAKKFSALFLSQTDCPGVWESINEQRRSKAAKAAIQANPFP
jgi:hypothetical protein